MLEKILNKEIHKTKADALEEVRASMTHNDKIEHYTHNLYKYPACFPPSFPRAVIQSFSKEGDWILDPFIGGGTTGVEAMVAGRNFVGSDINELAVFSSRLKTTTINSKELAIADRWIRGLQLSSSVEVSFKGDQHFFLNVPKLVETGARRIAAQIKKLKNEKVQILARGALLRLCQLELEHRLSATTLRQLENDYKTVFNQNLHQTFNLSLEMEHGPTHFLPEGKVILGNAAEPGIVRDWSTGRRKFKLVLTSPPYAKRHILYHKWQVNGRQETRLPYWIISSNQVEPEQFYTMGARDTEFSLELYISTMFFVFENLNAVMEHNGVLVQVVAFTNVARQLPLFLAALNETGFEEIRNIDPTSVDGRLWRKVPNRKWFNRVGAKQPRCSEVVLFHRKRVNA